MKQEYCFTLTVPLHDLEKASELLAKTQQDYPVARITRKTDRKGYARFYLSFPFSQARPDLKFHEWLEDHIGSDWDLYGPVYGRWGLS